MDYYKTKALVKNKLCVLDDYSINEEDFLLEEIFLEKKEKLLTRDFSKKDLKKINKFLKIRLSGKPITKIFKHCYFYKDDFYINDFVLSPRQETELVVENAIKIINNLKQDCVKVLDLCCGSGIIGLSVAKHSNKKALATLSDISKRALNVTRKNAKRLNLEKQIKIVKSNMFEGLKQEKKFDIILSNPPYIRTKDVKNLSVGVKKYDPKISLDGGEDGLDFYKIICKQSKMYLNKKGFVIVEIGYNQGKEAEKLFFYFFFSTKLLKDYSNNDRIIIANLKNALYVSN